MIRNETFVSGVCVSADIIDLDAGTFTREENGQVVSSRPLTDEERAAYGPSPEELARASAVAKLQTLGLTEEEALALVGGV